MMTSMKVVRPGTKARFVVGETTFEGEIMYVNYDQSNGFSYHVTAIQDGMAVNAIICHWATIPAPDSDEPCFAPSVESASITVG